MNDVTYAILKTYLKVAQKYKKPYCWQAQKYTLVLLAKYHQIHISLRTLNRRLRWLEDGNYIKRLQRGRRRPDGTFQPGSTLTTVLARSFWYLAREMKRTLKIFAFYRLPRMAKNMFNTTDYQSLVDKLAYSEPKFVHQGGASRVFSRA